MSSSFVEKGDEGLSHCHNMRQVNKIKFQMASMPSDMSDMRLDLLSLKMKQNINI